MNEVSDILFVALKCLFSHVTFNRSIIGVVE